MQLIVVRETQGGSADKGTGLLRYALSTVPLQAVVGDSLCHPWPPRGHKGLTAQVGRPGPDDSCWILPRRWKAGLADAASPVVFYDEPGRLQSHAGSDQCREAWTVIANGRFATRVNPWLLEKLVETARVDILAVTAAPDLRAGRERLRLTTDNKVVGYRRFYADSIAPVPVPGDWPHYLLVRREALDTAWESGLLGDFTEWADRCRAAGPHLQSVAIAGVAYDLESEPGLLAMAQAALGCAGDGDALLRRGPGWPGSSTRAEAEISPQARLIGPVLMGRQVTVAAGAVVVGPAILCDGSTVGQGTIVDSAIVGAGVAIEPNRTLGRRVLTAAPEDAGRDATPRTAAMPWEPGPGRPDSVFRQWPRLSYARCFKRMADLLVALIILILFVPAIAVIALAIKIGSPGPVFFRDRRQGLHGRPFQCVKFRTMREGADKIQDKLRFVSEVDGPQFKMADDPRITTIGRFLRETYLDEIPQFFNVLWGQMSVVGPRPSPEAENTLCPSWRDARLSVRPGITGLWQIRRTREPHRDFQEWIQYDTQYVRDLSPGLDAWICWRTFTRMVGNFVSQF